jgi:glucose-6-phosphate 1-dehydrogenase
MQAWQESKSHVVSAIRPLTPETTVRGQYDGYLDVEGVAKESTTETYVTVRLAVDSWRWSDVPVLIRAGKCMPLTATEISIRFKRPPHDVFHLAPQMFRNTLRFRIWPEAHVGLEIVGKRQGAGWRPQPEALTFSEMATSDMRPYDRLIGAALTGQRWLFASQRTVEAAWQVVDPVLGDVVPVHSYERGTWGPKEADALLPEGDVWHDPEK